MGRWLFISACCVALFSCRVDPEIVPSLPTAELREIIPEGWPQPVYRFQDNPISKERFELGRALFYETKLSKDNSISCGSCHQQFAAFANADHILSHGINEQLGNRNSPGMFNLTWHPSFMHDGGVNHIEVQPIAPITNPVEMGEELSEVILKLAADTSYVGRFRRAYGSDEINSQKMLKAMAQFMGLMYSVNSKYDQYKRGQKNVTLSPAEQRGHSLFVANCGSCHREPLFSDFEYRSNGIGPDPQLNDSGRAKITLNPSDLYRFKTPSLRNIAVTGPYMHDGRFSTLQECLDHYTSSAKNTTNLDPLLATPMALSESDKKDIIAFLHTLTDFEFLKDRRFSDPNFK